jgi:lysylphosphatidylglycerol synthetase-like protein (DUF2156 family)
MPLKNQISVTTSRVALWVLILSIFTSFFWIVVSVVYLVRPLLARTPILPLQWIISLLMLANAGVILLLGNGLRKRLKLYYPITIIYLVINMLLTITDDFGLADLVYLLFVVVLFILLLVHRRNLKR